MGKPLNVEDFLSDERGPVSYSSSLHPQIVDGVLVLIGMFFGGRFCGCHRGDDGFVLDG